jgi:hypothetical protein
MKVTLCGFGKTAPAIPGSGNFGNISKTVPFISGTINLTIWGNDQISPAGTFYCIQLIDADNNVTAAQNYHLLGQGAVDLSALRPYDPFAKPARGVTFIDAAEQTFWQMTMDAGERSLFKVDSGIGAVASIALIDLVDGTFWKVSVIDDQFDYAQILSGVGAVNYVVLDDIFDGSTWLFMMMAGQRTTIKLGTVDLTTLVYTPPKTVTFIDTSDATGATFWKMTMNAGQRVLVSTTDGTGAIASATLTDSVDGTFWLVTVDGGELAYLQITSGAGAVNYLTLGDPADASTWLFIMAAGQRTTVKQ